MVLITALDLMENSPRDLTGLEALNLLLESNAQRGRAADTLPLSHPLEVPPQPLLIEETKQDQAQEQRPMPGSGFSPLLMVAITWRRSEVS